MNQQENRGPSRRQFLKHNARIAGAAAVAGMTVPHVHAAEDNTIQVALVGCGGRGAGAVANAVSVENGPIKCVALADVFEARVATSADQLGRRFADQMDVPEERNFVGFDAYRKAIDCLKPGDVVILATPPAFRCLHFEYAIERGVNVFMEKPVTVDGPTTVKMLELAKQAESKNLKAAVGLMWRHCAARRELVDRVRQGELGDLIAMRCYRMHGPLGSFQSPPKPEGISHTLYQIQRFHSFLWASGGCYSDFYIHNIDELCWMKGAWPVEAQATGGRHYRGDSVDQNFDNYAVEYTFDDGAKLFLYGRCMPGCHDQFDGYAHGSKGVGVIASMGSPQGTCRIYRGQKPVDSALAWRFPGREPSSYQLQWNHLIDAIREDMPMNEVTRGAEASLVTSMGRMAGHTGRVIAYDDMLNCEHEFAPNLEQLSADSPPPLAPNPDGTYPVPMPGIVTQREY